MMDQQLLEAVREKIFVVRYAIDCRTHEATIGMAAWDMQLAAATIADRLGMRKESVLVISHRQVGKEAVSPSGMRNASGQREP